MREKLKPLNNMMNLNMSINDFWMSGTHSDFSTRLYNVLNVNYGGTTPISVLVDQYQKEGIMSFRLCKNMGRRSLNELNVVLSEISGLSLQELRLEPTRERMKRISKENLKQEFQSETLRLVKLVMGGIDSNQEDINLVIKSLGALNTNLKKFKK